VAGERRDFDAIVIGAGFSGMYMLKALRDRLRLKVRVYEAGETVGGTWYWNRYPGARCDSDSYVYCFTWDKQLWQEWEWSERYPEQPEIFRYLEHVAARHDLKRDIWFNTRVTGADFDESNNMWWVRTDTGEDVSARYLITAVGTLSDTNMPPFKGLERFQGKWCHTSRFPHRGIDFTAKRVAVVGTGATAVQAIPEISQQAKQLTVFQRTANYCLPARNGKVDPERVRARKADYDGIVERIRQSLSGFEYARIPKSALEATAEEREREFDRMWDEGGFAFTLANYQDMVLSSEANDLCADYIKRKIRKTVKDPVVAEKLIPKGHPYGTKRTPLDTNYYETYNKYNVLLIDAAADGPIEEITEKGIRAGGKEYEFDIIVFATGFDALTGPLKALNLTGRGGRKLNQVWGRRSAHLSRPLNCRFSQLVHDYRPAEPVGAVEYAGVDRAACRMDRGLHRGHAQERQDPHRSDARGAGAMGCPCQRDRQRDALPPRQLLVHERQHNRQAARLFTLSRSGRCRWLPEAV
jgi:cation diffusion facilitator CzcD-associated flavoprotein CzcO